MSKKKTRRKNLKCLTNSPEHRVLPCQLTNFFIHTKQTLQLVTDAQMDDPFLQKALPAQLAAAGCLLFCTCPISKKHFALLGVDWNHELCHFHGWKDDNAKAPFRSYKEACFATASRECAEESLEVVASEQAVLRALHAEQYIQLFPQKSLNVKCFAIFLGFMGPQTREDVTMRFSKLSANPALKDCQRELKAIVWVPASELYKGTVEAKSKSAKKVNVQLENGTLMNCRSWLTGWFIDSLLLDNKNDMGTTHFLNICTQASYSFTILPISHF